MQLLLLQQPDLFVSLRHRRISPACPRSSAPRADSATRRCCQSRQSKLEWRRAGSCCSMCGANMIICSSQFLRATQPLALIQHHRLSTVPLSIDRISAATRLLLPYLPVSRRLIASAPCSPLADLPIFSALQACALLFVCWRHAARCRCSAAATPSAFADNNSRRLQAAE
jgi:hypothetical protein